MSRRDDYTFSADPWRDESDDYAMSAAWLAEALAHFRPRPERDRQLELWEQCS